MADGQGQGQGQGQQQVPQDPVAQAFQNLQLEIANVSHALTAQGISSSVVKFDGNPKNYKEWIKSIEKYATLTNLPDARKRLIAYQSSSGAVSGFIHRYMQANPLHTWDQIKQQLAVRFSDITDAQMALAMLRSVRQKHGENIQTYAERILSLAEDAYGNLGGDAVERQLIDIFVDGLQLDHLKLKILRDQPNTLQGAIAICTNENNLRARVSMSHTKHSHEPMEVDHTRGRHYRKYPQQKHRVNETVTRKIICWNCGREGHISRDCRAETSRGRPPMGHGRSQTKENRLGRQEN